MDVRLPARCPGDPCHQPEGAWAARRSRKDRRGSPNVHFHRHTVCPGWYLQVCSVPYASGRMETVGFTGHTEDHSRR